jgi:hypothetical protein
VAAEDKTVKDVLDRAEDTLYTAKLGLAHVKGNDPRARAAGLRNVVVFGRAVTNVLQNLRSIAPGFDDWYRNHITEMEKDELMRFFYRIRSEILKQGALSVHSSMTFSGNPMEVFKHFKPPPRAKAFFIRDPLGGSGWEVETDQGAIEKYYVQIPDNLPGLQIDINIHLTEAPEQFRDVPAGDLCEKYLGYLSTLIAEAKSRFLSTPI